jgi:hypothetical protein
MLGLCLLRLSLPAHMAGAPMPVTRATRRVRHCAVRVWPALVDAPSLGTLALAAGRADVPIEAARRRAVPFSYMARRFRAVS